MQVLLANNNPTFDFLCHMKYNEDELIQYLYHFHILHAWTCSPYLQVSKPALPKARQHLIECYCWQCPRCCKETNHRLLFSCPPPYFIAHAVPVTLFILLEWFCSTSAWFFWNFNFYDWKIFPIFSKMHIVFYARILRSFFSIWSSLSCSIWWVCSWKTQVQ